VVADEIGKLAVQTSDSIKEIEGVLAVSTRTTTEGVEVIKSTAEMVKGFIGNMAENSEKIKVLRKAS
jgi:methyl-accepting chemotaxis protein